MVANRVCNLKRRRAPCLEHCNNWGSNNYKSLPEQLKSDLNYLRMYEKYFDVNIELVILISIFILLSFVIYIIFNLRN